MTKNNLKIKALSLFNFQRCIAQRFQHFDVLYCSITPNVRATTMFSVTSCTRNIVGSGKLLTVISLIWI